MDILKEEKDLDFIMFSNYYENDPYFIFLNSIEDTIYNEALKSYEKINIYNNEPFQMDATILIK